MGRTAPSAIAVITRRLSWFHGLSRWRRNDTLVAKSIGFATLVLVVAATVGAAILAPRPPLVGVVAATHAVERPGEIGFGNRLEFRFIRFLPRGAASRSLEVRYRYRWGTATPEDVEGGSRLGSVQTVRFSAPTPADRDRGWQDVTATLVVVADDTVEFRESVTVALEPSSGGDYVLVPEDGVLVPGLNRRWAVPSAECTIYEGCVLACLPGDLATAQETTSADAGDIRQSVADCYLIAALIAAVRRDSSQVRDLIEITDDGCRVTFPGAAPISLPRDIDRGPDMVDLAAADVDSQGRVEIWPVLLEQAYALLDADAEGVPADQSFYAVAGGDAAEAYRCLTGRGTKTRCPDGPTARENFPDRRPASRAEIVRLIRETLATGQPVMLSTGDDPPPEWLGRHVYVVKSVGESGITLINPLDGCDVASPFGDWFENHVQRVIYCR